MGCFCIQRSFLFFGFGGLFAALSAEAVAQALILPVEAIEASAVLRVDAFHQAYPGIAASAETLGMKGYFVVYEHEALRYYFGPVENMADAREAEGVLLGIRGDVVEQREALATSLVYIYRFDLEEGGTRWPATGGSPPPVPGSPRPEPEREAPDSRPQNEEPQPPPSETTETREESPHEQASAPPAPPPRPTFWQILRRVFSL